MLKWKEIPSETLRKLELGQDSGIAAPHSQAIVSILIT